MVGWGKQNCIHASVTKSQFKTVIPWQEFYTNTTKYHNTPQGKIAETSKYHKILHKRCSVVLGASP